jgi:hypothetical protein
MNLNFAPIRHDKSLVTLFLFRISCSVKPLFLLTHEPTHKEGDLFFCGVKGNKNGLLVPTEKWVRQECLCILGIFLEQRTYLHFTFLKNIPVGILLVHEFHLNVPCVRLRVSYNHGYWLV